MPERAIALGFFDGVHLGHGALLREAARAAQQHGLNPAAISFSTHPSALLAPHASGLLTTPEERARLMRECYGIPELLMLPFDEALMHESWEHFLEDRLIGTLGARYVVCGENFRFGYRGEGTAELLQARCRTLGIGCSVIPQVRLDGVPVSSTLIRALLQRGAMQSACALLGHPYSLTGTVVHGRGLGHTLGFPTANLDFPEELLPPAFGVYACRAHVGEITRPAVVNLGVKPTVQNAGRIGVEAWILDYSGDLYGKTLRLDFLRHLRPERRFSTLDALRDEIFRNARQARAVLETGN